jgi:uncharacterized membrane protein
MNVDQLLQALLLMGLPWVSQWLCRWNGFKKMGPVVVTYAFGILLGNLAGPWLNKSLSLNLSGLGVLLAIPLMLFPTDLKLWPRLARPLLVSFGLACVAAVVSAASISVAFRSSTDEWYKVAGMLVGVYVGGTANMTAVGLALGVKQETFLLLNAADIITGGAYLLVLLSVAQRIVLTFLRPFVAPVLSDEAAFFEIPAQDPKASRWLTLGLALGVVAVSGSITWIIHKQLEPALLMLLVTTLALAASLFRSIRRLPGTSDMGEYFLLVFCISVGSLADLRQVASGSSTLFLFVLFVMSASAVLHFALCRIFGIDADTALISQTATIFGPPFIGPVAKALNNPTLVGPGLTLGLMGIALGTYLGLATSWTLRAVFAF